MAIFILQYYTGFTCIRIIGIRKTGGNNASMICWSSKSSWIYKGFIRFDNFELSRGILKKENIARTAKSVKGFSKKKIQEWWCHYTMEEQIGSLLTRKYGNDIFLDERKLNNHYLLNNWKAFNEYLLKIITLCWLYGGQTI